MATAARSATHLSTGARPRSRDPLELEAFRGFPYGVLVLDGEGAILCANREATRLIGVAGLTGKNLTCCALLGCRRPDTVLQAACLTELALAHDGAMPEIRVDLCTPEGPSAMWVAAASIGLADARVVLQLRPGVAGDRRKRTDPHWMSGARLRIRTLGRTAVESAEGPIGGAWLDQRTGQLLKYLVAERRRAAAVDEIGESIWPGADYAVGTSVRYYVHALRRRLEPALGSRAPSSFISAHCGTYRLRLEHVEIDADEFEAHLRAGLAVAESDPVSASAQIERGLAIYRGEFLADLPYAEWALPERHRLHDLACTGLRRLADIRLRLHMLDSAALSLEQLASMQPFDEDVHRQLMELDIMRGRRSDAVRRYAALRARIRRTFGHDPDFTPADLVPRATP
ncbi:MAG TPA: BTAD domain-containing putative transcriptional regulator [Solirubrobacteraceae bacterium]|nr:BTAD domain-containing putative transcriptional regulator [Solirubrobacteraceae bacterium]